MKAAEFRNLSQGELQDRLTDLKGELFNLRFQHAVRQLPNTQRLKDVKRDIARVKTLIRERELDVTEQAGG